MADGENISTAVPNNMVGQTGFGGREAARPDSSFSPRNAAADSVSIKPFSREAERGDRRYSFNMLVATAVVGYAIGRLLPR